MTSSLNTKRQDRQTDRQTNYLHMDLKSPICIATKTACVDIINTIAIMVNHRLTSPSVGSGVCVYSSPVLLTTRGTFFIGHTRNTDLTTIQRTFPWHLHYIRGNVSVYIRAKFINVTKDRTKQWGCKNAIRFPFLVNLALYYTATFPLLFSSTSKLSDLKATRCFIFQSLFLPNYNVFIPEKVQP